MSRSLTGVPVLIEQGDNVSKEPTSLLAPKFPLGFPRGFRFDTKLSGNTLQNARSRPHLNRLNLSKSQRSSSTSVHLTEVSGILVSPFHRR